MKFMLVLYKLEDDSIQFIAFIWTHCHQLQSIYIYKQMFVYLSLGMWRANGNANPCTDLDEIFPAHPHLSKEGFGAGLTPTPSLPGPGGLETLKAEGHIFKMLTAVNPGSAGYLS